MSYMKVLRSYRVSEEVDVLLKAESARLTEANGGKPKVSEADVIEFSVVRYLGEPTGGEELLDGWEVPVTERIAAARAIVQNVETRSAEIPPTPKPNLRSESVAQRKERESKEHAAKLAESDTIARMVGRTDIDYDLEHVPHRSVAAMGVHSEDSQEPRILKEPTVKKSFAPLTRPHGKAEAKRRREQG